MILKKYSERKITALLTLEEKPKYSSLYKKYIHRLSLSNLSNNNGRQ